MTPQFAYIIYKKTLKETKNLGVKVKGNYIAWKSEPFWSEENGELVQEAWSWSKIKELARGYKGGLIG